MSQPTDPEGTTSKVEPSPDADELASGVPYRAIAMVLLTLVIIAVGVGIAQLLGGDKDDSAPAAASSSQSAAPRNDAAGANPANPQAPGAPPVGPGGSAEASSAQPVPPAQPSAAPAPDAQGAAAAQSPAAGDVNVNVYNNSMVHGLADKVAGQLRNGGAHVTEVGNFAEANIPQSGVYYGTGAGEQQEAERIAQELGVQALPRTPGLQQAPGGVIVIVTQDLNR